jgi:C4-dicarboxylate transporter DctM subunit
VILACALVLLVALGVPLFAVIGWAAVIAFSLYGGAGGLEGLEILVVKMASLTTKNVFLAIPFFVVSGAIMGAGSIAGRLCDVAAALVGGVRGGLAVTAIVASVIFAAVSGSSPVTLIAIGGILLPAMLRAGYREPFALGLVTTAGSLGCLVPPSIPMLVYAISVTGTSAVDVRELFLAGLGAAVVIAGMLAAYAVLRAGPATAAGAAAARPPFSLARLRLALRRGAWALAMPAVVLGGIYGGLFTPTEAAAVSVVYAVVVEVLIHRSLTWRQLPGVVLRAATGMGGLLLIIVLSFAVNDFMVEQEIAEIMLEKVRSLGMGPVGFMLAVNLFLVVTGMFMDSISAIVLFSPIIAPAALALGIDPLHLGVVFIVNMEIGYLAPPIATNLFVAASIFRRPFGLVTRAVMPTLGVLCVGLLLVTFLPTLSVGPVYALRGESALRPFARPPERAASAPAPAPDPASAPPAPTGAGPPTQVLTLEEMMRLAKERREAAERQAGPGDAAR